MSSTRSPRRAEIDAFYTCQHPEQFRIDWRGFYVRAEARTDAVRTRWPHELDLEYGASERQRLDLYLPSTPSSQQTGWPLLLFLHGGGFREGDPALYGYLAEPYLQRGIAFASVGYRLTPESYLPSTFGDVEAVLAWALQNLPDRGVDTERLALTGHSAGAILTAHLAVRDDWLHQRALPSDLIKAAIPISGVYDFTAPDDRHDFFAPGADRSDSSPIHRLSTNTPPPMLIAYGSDENGPQYGADSRRLAEAIRSRGGRADAQALAGMTHADTADALGDASSPLFASVMALLSRTGVAASTAAV
ncbi:MAG: alpha/beta hydrolase [Chloroflexi bacterium]|nr:alpha/beta hydrolase [Chloroflexota bacterium]